MKNITFILILISCFLLSYCSKETKNKKQSISMIDSTVTMGKKENYDIWIDDKAFWSEDFFRETGESYE